MPAKPVKIADRDFPTKGAATEYYKAILNHGEVGRSLEDSEFADVMDLLAMHPRASEKIAAGVLKITIQENPKNRKLRGFQLHRADGVEDFSYPKCLSGEHPPFTDFSKACRAAVEGRIYRWKSEQMDGKEARCAITNDIVTWDEAHVDHKAPMTFSVIARTFIEAREIDLDAVSYLRVGVHGTEFEDAAIAESFDKYHARLAILRIVKAKENLKRAGGARVKPTSRDGTLL